MSSILSKPFTSKVHYILPKHSSTSLDLGSGSKFLVSSRSHGFLSLPSLKTNKRNMWMVIKCNGLPIPPIVPSPSPAASGPGKGWLVGIILTVILPFLKMGKWGPLMLYKNNLDTALQRVEDTVEMLEKVAERVDKKAEELYTKLPEGKLKDAVGLIEHVAEEAAKDAHLVDAAIDKVQELEEKAEKYVKSGLSETKKIGEEEAKTIDVEAV